MNYHARMAATTSQKCFTNAAAALPALFVVLTLLASTSGQQPQRIQIRGFTPDQVREALGSPSLVTGDTWYYDRTFGTLKVFFEGGAVARWIPSDLTFDQFYGRAPVPPSTPNVLQAAPGQQPRMASLEQSGKQIVLVEVRSWFTRAEGYGRQAYMNVHISDAAGNSGGLDNNGNWTIRGDRALENGRYPATLDKDNVSIDTIREVNGKVRHDVRYKVFSHQWVKPLTH